MWDRVRGQAALPLRRGEPADPHHCPRENWGLPGGELLRALFPVRDRWDISGAGTHIFCTQHSVLFHLSSLLFFPSLCWSRSRLLLSPVIVKPDKVRISKVNTTMIEWSYPSSWSSPFSYFPLTFQIAQLKRQCKRCDDPCVATRATKVGGPCWYFNKKN